MMRTSFTFAAVAVAVLGCAGAALADTSISEIGTSGLASNYYDSANSNGHYMASDWFATMPILGPGLVNYTDPSPSNPVGPVPSPGYYDPAEAAQFDQASLSIALHISGGNVTVTLTTAMSPTTGYLDTGGWPGNIYGQGDMFLSVDNKGAVTQYALLNDLPTGLDSSFNTALAFRSGPGVVPGALVELSNSNQVAYVGGNGSYSGGYGPEALGLDSRVYAQGGTLAGAGALTITSTSGTGFDGQAVTWYTEAWTFSASDLDAGTFDDISLHAATTCGNDQIGLDTGLIVTPQSVPAPAAVLLGLLGLSGLGVLKRRGA